MSDVRNILLVGVGGQGTLLASKILSAGLLQAGHDVKMSEVHGMAQRGGSVSSQVRYGTQVHSPIFGRGQADILVSFEAMEALRWLDHLKPTGKAVVNNHQIPSVPILCGQRVYPAQAVEQVARLVPTTVLDAAAMAAELGNPKAMNIIMLGALVGAMGLDSLPWELRIQEQVKPAFLELNLRAFAAGLATSSQPSSVQG